MSGGSIAPAQTVLRSGAKTVTIARGRPFCIIGERINPTGRKKFAEDLREGELSTVTHDALTQVEAGADMLDVNAGIPLVDESELLKTMLRTVQQAVDVPICIDSSVIEALEAGLSVYEGRALVNSVTAEDERLEEILPLVARHDAAVIGLANDETGIPETPEKRLECARKIVAVAAEHGIARDDVVIDPLAMTVGADAAAVQDDLETISLIRDELGVNMCLGASNISFGLPQRLVLNAAFLPMAMAAGLTSAIMSTADVCVDAVRAADLLLGHDEWGASWIAAHRARQATVAQGGPGVVSSPSPQRRRLELAGAGAVDPAPADGAERVRLRFLPEGGRSASPAGRPCSTRRAGTGSRSTRRAAVTGRARSAAYGSCPARCRSGRWIPGRSRSTSSATGGGSRAGRRRAATSSSRCRRCRPVRRRRWPASGVTSSCGRRCRSATWC